MEVGTLVLLTEPENDVVKAHVLNMENAEVRMRIAGEDIIREREELYEFIFATHPELKGCRIKFTKDFAGVIVTKEST